MHQHLKTIALSVLTVTSLMVSSATTEAAWYCAGSLWHNEHAKLICPSVCVAYGGWDGVWTSGPFADRVCGVAFAGSICECRGAMGPHYFNWKHMFDREGVPTSFMDE